MMLRYVVLGHRIPETEAEWTEYLTWKQRQLHAAECDMAKTEVSPDNCCKSCDSCQGGQGCTKRRGVQEDD